MPIAMSLAEQFKVVEGLTPQVGAAAAVLSDYVSLKNLQKLFVVVNYNQGDADNQTWKIMRATDVTPTGAVVIANAVNIWSNLDCVTSDTLVKRTAAINYASGTGATHKLIIFEIDPATLGDDGSGNDYTCVAVGSTGAVAATSYASITFIGVPKYAGPAAMQPSITTD
jgi:hypothetical protein